MQNYHAQFSIFQTGGVEKQKKKKRNFIFQGKLQKKRDQFPGEGRGFVTKHPMLLRAATQMPSNTELTRQQLKKKKENGKTVFRPEMLGEKRRKTGQPLRKFPFCCCSCSVSQKNRGNSPSPPPIFLLSQKNRLIFNDVTMHHGQQITWDGSQLPDKLSVSRRWFSSHFPYPFPQTTFPLNGLKAKVIFSQASFIIGTSHTLTHTHNQLRPEQNKQKTPIEWKNSRLFLNFQLFFYSTLSVQC